MDPIKTYREFLKGDLWDKWGTLERDQERGLPPPPRQKHCPAGSRRVDLVDPDDFTVGRVPLVDLIGQRRSRRKFSAAPISLEELSFLLWATQGKPKDSKVLRTVPSAGARHPFETYLIVNRVEGVEPGLYRYLPLNHKMVFLRADPEFPAKVADACSGQDFVGASAVVFAWTAIPYRTEWRYSILSHKMIAMDAGHVCQNLYLASEAIGGGACGVGAYNHQKMDALLGVDGEDEFTVYLAPVGKLP